MFSLHTINFKYNFNICSKPEPRNMKYLKLKSFPKVLYPIAIFSAIILSVNSCKKDRHGDSTVQISDPTIVRAKAWYEKAFPANSKMGVQSIQDSADIKLPGNCN